MFIVINRDYDPPNNDNDNGHSEEVQLLLKKITRLIRMSHILFWAATPTASNGITDSEEFLKNADNNNSNPVPIDDEHIGPILLSPYGLKALANAGQITKEESEALMTCNLPPSQYGSRNKLPALKQVIQCLSGIYCLVCRCIQVVIKFMVLTSRHRCNLYLYFGYFLISPIKSFALWSIKNPQNRNNFFFNSTFSSTSFLNS